MAFKVVDDGSNSPVVQIKGRKYTPLEMLATFLEYLIQESSKQLGSSIKNAVITVPHYFDKDQLADIKEAAYRLRINIAKIVQDEITVYTLMDLKKKGSKVNRLY